jgi:acetyltransferase-like isoleucine patch superfamily enzyme
MKLYLPLLKWMGIKLNGVPRYIGKDVKFDEYRYITLGDRVVISNECFLLIHDYSVTTAMIAIGEKPETDVQLIRGIVLGNNVFVGKRSIIMPNTTIGNDVIIGAGSVVRGNIPDNSVVMGNPCQIIGSVTEQANKWKKYLTTNMVEYD